MITRKVHSIKGNPHSITPNMEFAIRSTRKRLIKTRRDKFFTHSQNSLRATVQIKLGYSLWAEQLV